MTTLTAFISDRIEEDEAVAQAAIDPERPGTHWHWVNVDDDTEADFSELCTVSLRTIEEYPTAWVGDLPAFALNAVEIDEPRAHTLIARFDPARVLKECAVKRYILQSYVADGEDPHPGFPCTDDIEFDPDGEVYEALHPSDRGACERHLASWGHQHHSEFVLKVLALAWADHPDYNQEWAVGV